MPNYQERSELLRQLANQAYFDAKRSPNPQKDNVQVGGYDGRTGRYRVIHADGGVSSNGVSISNAAPPSDRFVRGIKNPNTNAVPMEWRNRKAEPANILLDDEPENVFLNLGLIRVLPAPFGEELFVVFIADSALAGTEFIQRQVWSAENELAVNFLEWEPPAFPSETLTDQNIFNGVWALSSGVNPVSPDALSYEYSANKDWMYFEGNFGIAINCFQLSIDITFIPNDAFNTVLEDLVEETISSESLIEAEVITNVGNVQEITFGGFDQGALIFTIDTFFEGAGTTTSSIFSFQFRYRRRDKTNWFEL